MPCGPATESSLPLSWSRPSDNRIDRPKLQKKPPFGGRWLFFINDSLRARMQFVGFAGRKLNSASRRPEPNIPLFQPSPPPADEQNEQVPLSGGRNQPRFAASGPPLEAPLAERGRGAGRFPCAESNPGDWWGDYSLPGGASGRIFVR